MCKYLKDILDTFKYRLLSLKETLGRMIYWGWKMRNSYDFDAHTVYDILHHKLDKIHQAALKDPYHVWTEPNTKLMKRLKEASILAKRIREDNYQIRAFQEADEKFTYKHWLVPSLTHRKSSIFKSTYEKTPERARLFRKGRDKIYMKVQQHEVKRFHMLLEKYIDKWWF